MQNGYKALADVLQQVEDAFTEMVSVKQDLDLVFKAMKSAKLASEEQQALDRSFNELQVQWDRAYRALADAQVRFITGIREVMPNYSLPN